MPQAALIWAVPALMSAIGTTATVLKNRAQANRAKDQAKLNNQAIDQYGQGQKAYRDYVQGITPEQRTQTSHGTSSSDTNYNETTTPGVTPELAGLVGQIKSLYEGRMRPGGGLPAGYVSNQLRNINQTNAGALANVSNYLARYGGANPSAAIPIATARMGQQNDFLGNVPLIERENQSKDALAATNFAEIFGKTTNRRGSSHSVGTQDSSTQLPMPILDSGAFLPPGPYNTQQTGGSTLGDIIGGLGPLLAGLYQNGAFGQHGMAPRTGIAPRTGNPGDFQWPPI